VTKENAAIRRRRAYGIEPSVRAKPPFGGAGQPSRQPTLYCRPAPRVTTTATAHLRCRASRQTSRHASLPRDHGHAMAQGAEKATPSNPLTCLAAREEPRAGTRQHEVWRRRPASHKPRELSRRILHADPLSHHRHAMHTSGQRMQFGRRDGHVGPRKQEKPQRDALRWGRWGETLRPEFRLKKRATLSDVSKKKILHIHTGGIHLP
jgi:hypothetical protein